MAKELIGRQFNSLTILDISKERKYNALNYECKCVCGRITLATKGQLTSGKKKSCGCLMNIKPLRGSVYEVNIGDIYGRLTVLSEKYPTSKRTYNVNCSCECGINIKVTPRQLIKGIVVSCGCRRLEGDYKHGMCYSRPYKIHGHMRRRCDTPNEAGYPHYGGRGITYDPKWATFEGFWEDMKNGYDNTLELDRIDSNKNYCKANCRWVDSNLQAFNTGKRKDNTSGCTGVSWNKRQKLWEVYINVNKKSIKLGKYSDLELAIFIRKEAEIKYYGFYKKQ